MWEKIIAAKVAQIIRKTVIQAENAYIHTIIQVIKVI